MSSLRAGGLRTIAEACGRWLRDENPKAVKTGIMKINFTVPTFYVIRVDEIKFLSQFDENKLRKWERE
jgi:hypothetical protein